MTDFSDIINFYYGIETDVFDIIEKRRLCTGGEYLSAFSTNVTEFGCNHVVPIGRAHAHDVMIAAVDEFSIYNREPVACVTPLCDDYYSGVNPDLQLFNTDAWMLFNKKLFKTDTISSGITVRTITLADVDSYIDVFYKGFSDGVYEGIEQGYATTERKSFKNPYKTKLMAFYKEKPIGVVGVDVKGNIGYIESFAVLPQYRYGGETARVLGNAAIDMCYNNGVNKIFIITAAGTVLERFYKTNGFTTMFYGYFYKWRK